MLTGIMEEVQVGTVVPVTFGLIVGLGSLQTELKELVHLDEALELPL